MGGVGLVYRGGWVDGGEEGLGYLSAWVISRGVVEGR